MRHSAKVILLLLALLLVPVVNVAQEPPVEGDPGTAADPAVTPDEPEGGVDAPELAEPEPALPPLPQPTEVELIDIPNDGGTALGLLWKWSGSTEGVTVRIETKLNRQILDDLKLSADEQSRLDAALGVVKGELASVLPALEAAEAKVNESSADLILALANKDPEYFSKLRANWKDKNEVSRLNDILNVSRDKLLKMSGDLEVRARTYDFYAAAMDRGEWIPTNFASFDAAGAQFTGVPPQFPDKDSRPDLFGHNPAEGDKLFAEIDGIQLMNPGLFDGTFQSGLSEYGIDPQSQINMPLSPNTAYEMRMVLANADGELVIDLPAAEPKRQWFNAAYTNNLIFSILFATIILSSIIIARRNPNLFIRRIQGLEAVDEAIGRATEMGKPVLYLCGLDPLSTLSTLAAVNILGRVARRIADYDSDLVVPCRDPVVLTVAQEVVKEAYVEQGRPDAFREDKIYFVTDDQFSFTASVCAIMMREKPAANFFMGYYYAESLLLAETGASTGAIQIAGTDATHQLPFFITTCDYTLIGEELYAASAYMSREPMLLGSLKGQDVGKAFMMILIILQTLLFLFNSDWNWLKLLVEPL